jgi:hypothetical protein
MCPLGRVFTCGFNTTLLRHIAVVTCVNGCPKIMPAAGLVADLVELTCVRGNGGHFEHLLLERKNKLLMALLFVRVSSQPVGLRKITIRHIMAYNLDILYKEREINFSICILGRTEYWATCMLQGRISKYVANGSETTVMDVIDFLCVSLDSTVQLHEYRQQTLMRTFRDWFQ